jgi:hypothetical protein
LDLKPKGRRKSTTTAGDDGVEAGPPKKRGRPSKANKEVAPESDDGDEAPVSKKPRKSNGAKAATKGDQDDSDDAPPVGNMDKYLKIPSWEHLIDTVDTVERDGDKLMVYFTLCVHCHPRLCQQL